jgi:hypothetical protein
MFVEQRLASCKLCSRSITVRYEWSGSSLTSARTLVRTFACPSCGHPNPMFVPCGAYPFVVKVLPEVVRTEVSAQTRSTRPT